MITMNQAKEVIHAQKLNILDELLVLLAISPMEPLQIEQIKERCINVGLRRLAKKNISGILGASKGLVARTKLGWELQIGGRRRLEELVSSFSHQEKSEIPINVQRNNEKSPILPDRSKRKKVLIIHGHDERNRLKLKDFLQSKMNCEEPIIMSQKLMPGLTLPEKFEKLAQTVDFAIAVLTPDDLGRARGEDKLKLRPRQNAIIEIGWFWGRLGRQKVLLLVQEELDLASDLSDLQGIEYHRFNKNVDDSFEKVREFFAAHDEVAE